MIIDRGLEALRLKARALHGTAVAFNAGFDLAAMASPASFNGFESSLRTLRGLTSERQRPALDLVVGWLKKGVPGVPIVSSLAGVVMNAFGTQADNRRGIELKKAGERLEYDLSRSSADLGGYLGDALAEPPAMPACEEETRELAGRYAQIRPAVHDLRESLAALASADDGLAVFVPPLPGR